MNFLAGLLDESARRFPKRIAVSVPGGKSISYGELASLSERLRNHLLHLGIRRGDRVGIRLHKSIDAVVSIFAILKAGAAYVPVDADSPATRGAFILDDCQVRAIVTERKLEGPLTEELGALGASPAVLVLDQAKGDLAVESLLDSLSPAQMSDVADGAAVSDDVAYILYTSGSTGNPKGVVLSQGNAESFLRWCSETLQPGEEDVFSSHAPFHFDLSILDIFVPIKHGARLVLFGESIGKDPLGLASAISAERVTVWYSTPSILSLLAHYGRLERYDWSALRTVLFAGEVFPVPQFRALNASWRKQRYFNLYGPTETNVCTYYEVPGDDSWAGMDSFPIGGMCKPNMGMVVDELGHRVTHGEPGELVVTGPNVMKGYWNLPELTRQAFLSTSDGRSWYRTGDIVREGPDGEYRYLGRRDRMVKRRGYRVELGEIEAALIRDPAIREAAVVAVHSEDGVRLAAFVRCAEGRPLTIVALKGLSAQCLPPYMIPDVFKIVDALPRTSTNKVDFQFLRSQI